MKAAVRREAPAVAAVVVAVLAVLAPLTLGGRLASSADTDAFYAPFATFLHDRLSAGDLPFWAPGAFSGQPFLADAQSGVTYPPMLLASWLLGPVDALRAVATFHYLIAALGAYALARQLRASRTGSAFGAIAFAASGHLVARSAALGLLGGAAWLAPALALAEATASARPARRGFAIAGLAAVLALHLASGSQQLAALTLATCVLWLLARAGARGIAIRGRGDCARIRPRGAGTAPAARVAPRSNRFGLRRSRRDRLVPVRRPPRPGRALRRLALGDRDAVPGRGDAGARADRLAARSARRRARCGCWGG